MKSVVETYRDLAKNNPPWTPDEEKEAIKKWFASDNDIFIEEALKHNLAIVFNLVRKMTFKINDDIMQCAVSSMVNALKKFDPSKKIKISTWITNPIRWSILRFRDAYLHQCTIAEELSYLNNKYGKQYISVSLDDERGGKYGDDDGDKLIDRVSEESVNVNFSIVRKLKTSEEIQSQNEREEMMKNFIKNMPEFLDKREIKIIKSIMTGKRLSEIAKDMNLSRMRISQMSREAYAKIRNSKWAEKLKEFM